MSSCPTLAMSCVFVMLLCTQLRKISPQLRVQAMIMFRLGYCSAVLAGLPVCMVKSLQMVQNVVVGFLFYQPKSTCHSITHWTSLSTHDCPDQIQVTNACRQSDCRVCIQLSKISQTGLYSLTNAVLSEMSSGTAILIHKAGLIKTVCGSMMV